MKVVKCLDHIPKELWGNVYEKDRCYTDDWEKHYVFKTGDTFPLPEVGEKVLASYDGEHWDTDAIVYLGMSDEYFMCEVKNIMTGKIKPHAWEYIKPIENNSLKSRIAELEKKIEKITEEIIELKKGF